MLILYKNKMKSKIFKEYLIKAKLKEYLLTKTIILIHDIKFIVFIINL